jgi:hypothetical protein
MVVTKATLGPSSLMVTMCNFQGDYRSVTSGIYSISRRNNYIERLIEWRVLPGWPRSCAGPDDRGRH